MLLSNYCYSQVLSKQDSIKFKSELEALLKKYGLKTAGYQISVQSKDQRGGQTAFTIMNNNYTTVNYGIVPRKLTDVDKVNLMNRIEKQLFENKAPKNTLINIGYIMGNDENQNFGSDVGAFLMRKGYNVKPSLSPTMGAEGDGFVVMFYKNEIFIHVGTALHNDRP